MGILDRFRSAGKAADDNRDKAHTSEQDALRLIEEGHAHEADGRIDEAMQCYQEAIRLAPKHARAHLNHGNALLAKGDLKGALDAFKTAIKLEPDYAEVHCSTGVALERLGQLDDAVASYNRAMALDPDLIEARSNLDLISNNLFYTGNVLASQGQLESAVESYRQALEINPDFAEVHCNMGLANQELGLLDEAVAHYRLALEIKPDLAEAHGNLGSALHKLGEFENAVASYRCAVNLQPDFVEAHCNLGLALQKTGRIDSAIASYQRALAIKPDYAEAYSNLGGALQTIGQTDRAVECYRKALEIKPDLAEAHLNLGCALQGIRQIDRAVECYRKALEIKPDLAEAHMNLGCALHDLKRYEDAVASFGQALEFKPDYAEAHSNLGIILRDLGQFDGAEACFRLALEIDPDLHQAHSDLLFVLHHTASHTPSYILGQAREFGRIVSGKAGVRFPAWQCTDQPEHLRVGLVSGDLCNHVVGHFLEGLLAHIDPDRIELIAYPTHYQEDELTTRIRPCFSAWKPLFGKSDEAAAHLIHDDGVHVLLDISGHTGHNRLPMFAWKPAPVQASWLGYFATTGVAEMDYLLADEVGVPRAQRGQFTETVCYLPDTRLCFTAPEFDLPVAPMPALTNGVVTFGCFQNLSKVNGDVLAEWGKIFAALPNAKLRMQCKQLGDPAQMEQLLQRLQRHDISPARAELHGAVSREDYLAAHSEVDLILDTFPYPGGTTTCEALWMGVPTLTLAGDSLLARQGASILMAAGLEEWIAASKGEYIAKAIAMASDMHKLVTLRAGLRQQVLASPLFDAPRFARNFEDALWGMWESHQAK
jgi:protein O-GlcNAc transferase